MTIHEIIDRLDALEKRTDAANFGDPDPQVNALKLAGVVGSAWADAGFIREELKRAAGLLRTAAKEPDPQKRAKLIAEVLGE